MRTEQLDRRSEAAPPVPGGRRWRWAWLGAGTLLWLFAVHGRFDIAAAAWLSPVLLLRFVRTGPALGGLAAVWAASALAGVFWLVETAVPMTVIVVVGILALGTLTVVPYVLDRLVTPRAGTVTSLLLFPAALAACEFLMTLLSPFGTAFGVPAATQHDDLALLQVVSLTGPYGVGFLIGWFATTANHLWENRLRGYALRAAGAYAVVVMLALLAGGARLAFLPPDGATVRVAGISPDTSATRDLRATLSADLTPQQVASRDQATVRAAFGKVNANLLAMTREAARAGAKIVMWSEQAAGVLAADEQAFLGQVSATARESGVYLQAAVSLVLPRAPYAANRTYLYDPSGAQVWAYDKSHPIPGLEFYPPGDGVVPVARTPYGRLATVTCFDADFPELMRVDADIMLVPARDWAEIGPVHSQKASLRSIENGYAMVRQAEFGVSGAFDAQGRVLAAHDYAGGDRHVVLSDVPVRGATTVYRVIGDVFAWSCLAGTAVVIGLAVRRRTR
ncbi:nitrilase [Nonomuraea sp. KC401]|uniref:nitrilase-related carbon-nitrogen hydrolase n=1 Tax=unclassified Nonomuraea TaxID=2593643 RepID=UPI0010FD7C72|nr:MULTISPECIES: nitrilase-related carbon-nitrogen hydrolase [unclassified Nonomuraea]NBE98310.1 nitrilase [Nonomuraea sp. K271]TLF68431.1 nitrilase [Nonomuraea sp. KC401]